MQLIFTLGSVLSATVVHSAFASRPVSPFDNVFSAWKVKYNKVYANQTEEDKRFSIWVENELEIEAHNRAPGATYLQAHNQFSDLTREEFAHRHGSGGLLIPPIPAVARVLTSQLYLDAFESWVTQYNVQYSSDSERNKRYAIWVDNYLSIQEHNNNPQSTYTQGETRFMDITADEFAELVQTKIGGLDTLNIEGSSISGSNRQLRELTSSSSVDWRTPFNGHDITGPIRQQGSCESCWAHASVGVMQSMWALATNTSVTENTAFSIQEIIACKAEGRCRPGNPTNGYVYASTHGLESDIEYPYENTALVWDYDFPRMTCKATPNDNVDGLALPPGAVTAYVNHNCLPHMEDSCLQTNENAAKQALQHHPIVAAIDATARAWQFYKSGIMDSDGPQGCGSAPHVNHAIQIVGYGTSQQDTDYDYWIIKNSWGDSFGMDGYAYIAMDVDACGIGAWINWPLMVGIDGVADPDGLIEKYIDMNPDGTENMDFEVTQTRAPVSNTPTQAPTTNSPTAPDATYSPTPAVTADVTNPYASNANPNYCSDLIHRFVTECPDYCNSGHALLPDCDTIKLEWESRCCLKDEEARSGIYDMNKDT